MCEPKSQIEEGCYDLEAMAAEIRKIQAVTDRMMSTGLKRRTVVLLISDASGVGMRDVDAVLFGLESFAQRFLVEEE